MSVCLRRCTPSIQFLYNLLFGVGEPFFFSQLANATGMEVEYHPNWGLPGAQITFSHRVMEHNVFQAHIDGSWAPITEEFHGDSRHGGGGNGVNVNGGGPGEPRGCRPGHRLSVTLTLQAPSAGAGLSTWEFDRARPGCDNAAVAAAAAAVEARQQREWSRNEARGGGGGGGGGGEAVAPSKPAAEDLEASAAAAAESAAAEAEAYEAAVAPALGCLVKRSERYSRRNNPASLSCRPTCAIRVRANVGDNGVRGCASPDQSRGAVLCLSGSRGEGGSAGM